MNPSEVIREHAEPEFYTIPMQVGDIYLLFEEWLQYPHAAIPRKGTAELNRKVLLIGGQFFPSGKLFPEQRVEGLGLFYHYKVVDQAFEHVLPPKVCVRNSRHPCAPVHSFPVRPTFMRGRGSCDVSCLQTIGPRFRRGKVREHQQQAATTVLT